MRPFLRAARHSLRPLAAGAALFVVIVFAASTWITDREQDADGAVAHTVENEGRLARVLSLLQDAELGQRGYLLTGDAFYLEPYIAASSALGGELDQLTTGMSDNRRQDGNIAVLRSLATQKMSELSQTVDRRKAGDEAGALAVMKDGQGKVLMDGVREILTRMRAEEERLMAVRTDEAHVSALRMEITIIVLALLSAVLATVSLAVTLRRARSAEASRDELLARLDRKLMAVLAADVVGYSRRMEADEAGTLALLRTLRERVDPIILRHGGRVVTTAGDSVLAAFASALAAVDCAVEVQRPAAAAAQDDDPMLFRIGINVGDVIEQDGDIFGDTVNVAARLEGLAEPGGICVSRAVRDHVGKQRRYGFDDLGYQSVKNIAEPVSAHRIRVDVLSSDSRMP